MASVCLVVIKPEFVATCCLHLVGKWLIKEDGPQFGSCTFDGRVKSPAVGGNMWITVHIFRQSYLEGIHIVVHTNSCGCPGWTKKPREKFRELLWPIKVSIRLFWKRYRNCQTLLIWRCVGVSETTEPLTRSHEDACRPLNFAGVLIGTSVHRARRAVSPTFSVHAPLGWSTPDSSSVI